MNASVTAPAAPAAALGPAAAHPRAAVTAPIKLAYGAGQLVEAVSTTMINTFLFFFYTAVLGLPGSLAGAAAAISLVFDAVADPVLGSWSDNTRSRWGRRVPFMIAGAPIVFVTLGLAFAPPALAAPVALFAWLTALSMALRFAVSVFNVPFIALGAEISEDYAERSSVVAYRWVFTIVGGFVVVVLGYSVFLGGKGGVLHAASYAPLAWTCAVLTLAGGLASVLGIRRFSAGLPVAAADETAMHLRLFSEMREIFRNPSFRVMFTVSLLFYVAQGIATTLGVHMNTFVWRMNPQQIQVTVLGYFAGLVTGVPFAPLLARRLEKRTLLMAGLVVLCLAQGGLSGLRALGLIAWSGAAIVGPLTLNAFVAGIGVTFAAISVGSMMADAADEHDFLFNHRREGLYFAGLGFAVKAASGVGAMVGGLGLDLVGFPRRLADNNPGIAIAPHALRGLATINGPLVALLSALAIVTLLFYRIDRARHAQVVAAIAARRLGGV